MAVEFRILFQDEYLVAIHKPAGFFVHRPEWKNVTSKKSNICLNLLRDQIGAPVYPVHRLDRATSGVLLFAKDRSSASKIGKQFQEHTVDKTYWAIVRGVIPEPILLDHPLKREAGTESATHSARLEAQTQITPLHQIELPIKIGRYNTSRYSWVVCKPKTGRFHQIRRHLKSCSHPIVGDRVYGDSKHNRYFSESLLISGLLLRAVALQFTHPSTQKSICITSPSAKGWGQIQDLFGFCARI